MPIASGGYTRPSNAFSNPTFGGAIDPTDADELFDDIESGINDLAKGAGKVATINASTSSVTLDASTSRHFIINLSANVTTATITNWPENGLLVRVTVEVRNTGSFTFAHPGSVRWPASSAPVNTSGSGATDWYAYISGDNGTRIYGFPLGNDFGIP